MNFHIAVWVGVLQDRGRRLWLLTAHVHTYEPKPSHKPPVGTACLGGEKGCREGHLEGAHPVSHRDLEHQRFLGAFRRYLWRPKPPFPADFWGLPGCPGQNGPNIELDSRVDFSLFGGRPGNFHERAL
jgi:hypothetical protein